MTVAPQTRIMKRIVLRTSPRYLYRKLAFAVGVLAIGAGVLLLDLPSPIEWGFVALGVIGWSEVRGASVQAVGSVKVVALQLRNPELVIRRLPSARQFIARKALESGLPGVYLTLIGTDGDPERIVEAINRCVESGR